MYQNFLLEIKNQREARGCSVDDLSKETKISKKVRVDASDSVREIIKIGAILAIFEPLQVCLHGNENCLAWK